MRFKELPSPVASMRTWRARVQKWSFVITYESKTGPEFEGYTGYTASWKNENADMRAFGGQPANRIDTKPWKTFKEAEDACKNMFKQLRQRN